MNEKEFTTHFPEIFDRWGIRNEIAETRRAKPPVCERKTAALREIGKHAKPKAGWLLMPVLWLEAKAAELRQKADEKKAKAKKAA